MEVRLNAGDGDRIAVQYVSRRYPEGLKVVIAQEGPSELYVVLARGEDKEGTDAWTLMWRGNFDSAMRYFIGLVGDLEIDEVVATDLANGLAKADDKVNAEKMPRALIEVVPT